MNSNQALKIWIDRLESGDKNIALSNVGHVTSQQKYLIAILSYLNSESKYAGKRIGLVSFNLEQGLYKDFFSDEFDENETSFAIKSTLGNYFINWNQIIQYNISNDFISEYDLLLWDLPELNFINTHSQILQKYFMLFDSMLIVSLKPHGINDKEHVKRIHNFYNNHGLKLPSVVASGDTNFEKNNERIKKMPDLIRRIVGL